MEGGLLTKLLHPSVEFPDHLSSSRKNDTYLFLKNHTSLVLFNLSLHLLVKRYNDTGLAIDLSGFSKYQNICCLRLSWMNSMWQIGKYKLSLPCEQSSLIH